METNNEVTINGSSNEPGNDPNLKRKKIIREIISWFCVIAGGVLTALFIGRFIIVNANVPTGSMLNTIEVDSRIVAFRLSYLFSEPNQGDIIVFRYPLDTSILYVKRIIGMPGDTVQIVDGRVYVNGIFLEEDYVYVSGNTPPRNRNFGPHTVPNDRFFVLGDYRDISEDSRSWSYGAYILRPGDTSPSWAMRSQLPPGTPFEFNEEYAFVCRDLILGRVIFSYWPRIRAIR
ncbi:MAG: signal peptidase I [Defluviitaleaceae bacterium]|nr:signal peptidase I [Defluviitaleaceae bacterium]